MPGLNLAANLVSFCLLLCDVSLDIGLMIQIIADDIIHVRESQSGKLVNDLLRCGPALKGVHDGLEGALLHPAPHHRL